MSLKQLRFLAEKHNIGNRGNKDSLIAKIKRAVTDIQ
jgi:hypothetical protein